MAADNFNSLSKDVASIATIIDRLQIVINRLTDVSASLDKMLAIHETKIDAMQKVLLILEKKIEKNDNRLNTLEKWKWYVIGMATVVGFTISKLDVIKDVIQAF